jgi:hypothetical protein
MRLRSILMILAIALLIPTAANAGLYTYYPSDMDLGDLDHYKYYKWGINWNHPGETIVEAELKIRGIYNWAEEPNDILNIHLLDWAPYGVTVGTDNQNPTDYFAGMGPLVASWSDPNDTYADRQNLSWKFSDLGLLDEINTYASDGRFGFGFDPDCHYWNDKVYLKVTTAPVPEPGTLALLGLGLAGAGAATRRRRARKS